jgi:hypothetical protein
VSPAPTVGELLPRASEAFGISEKLSGYCLNLEHEVGAAKARAFEQILAIRSRDVAHLADALQRGVLREPISAVRDNAPFGVLCEVRIPVSGLGARKDRVSLVTTAWELRGRDSRPRLVTAYIDR